jgi:hypothetical protein
MKPIMLLIAFLAILTIGPTEVFSGDNARLPQFWRLHGDYVMTASGGCFHSSTGFNENGGKYSPNSKAVVWGATVAATAFWTFEPDGTGLVWGGTNYAIDFPPGETQPLKKDGTLTGVSRSNPIGFTFHYVVDQYGDIAVTPDNPIFPAMKGTISFDRKTMTLSNFNTLGVSPKGAAVCSVTRVLTKAADQPEP